MGACDCSLRLYLWNHVPLHAWHRRLLLCVLAFCLRLLKRQVGKSWFWEPWMISDMIKRQSTLISIVDAVFSEISKWPVAWHHSVEPPHGTIGLAQNYQT